MLRSEDHNYKMTETHLFDEAYNTAVSLTPLLRHL